MSLDFGLFAKLLVNSVSRYEDDDVVRRYEAKELFQDGHRTDTRELHWPTFFAIITSIIIGIIAFMLSWSCNTALDYNVVVKTVFGTFAFFFGFSYIILYLLLRWDTCAKIMKI